MIDAAMKRWSSESANSRFIQDMRASKVKTWRATLSQIEKEEQ